MKLKSGEKVVTAWCEHCAGQNWKNDVVWVLVDTTDGYRVACIQPEEHTSEIRALFAVSAVSTRSIEKAVKRLLEKTQ